MTVELTFDSYGVPGNPAVVLIHPFPFRAQFWSACAPVIAASGYFVIAPNLRGCATSPSDTAPPSMELLSADVWQLLDSLQVNNPTILGVSLGGYVTLAMLRARPDGVSAIGIIDSKVTADSPAAVRNRQRIAFEIQNHLTTSEYAQQMLPTLLSPFSRQNRQDVEGQVAQWISASKPETIAWLQEAMALRLDSTTELAKFAGPTLLIRGAEDVVSRPEDFSTMVELAQQPTFVEVPDCGHLPPVEDSTATAQVIIQWLVKSAFDHAS